MYEKNQTIFPQHHLNPNFSTGGGAGYSGPGVQSSDNRFVPGPQPALAYQTHRETSKAPCLGGSYTYIMNNKMIKFDGGFGGGGSAAKDAPGGAGGFSGGGGGPNQGSSGGGGTYFNQNLATNAQIEIDNAGEGAVVIEFLGPIVDTSKMDKR